MEPSILALMLVIIAMMGLITGLLMAFLWGAWTKLLNIEELLTQIRDKSRENK